MYAKLSHPALANQAAGNTIRCSLAGPMGPLSHIPPTLQNGRHPTSQPPLSAILAPPLLLSVRRWLSGACLLHPSLTLAKAGFV